MIITKKKPYSESDSGSMKNYDPNLGKGKSGYKKMMNKKMSTYIQATRDASRRIRQAKQNKLGNMKVLGGAQGNSNSTAMFNRAKVAKAANKMFGQ